MYFNGFQTTGGLISILNKCPSLEWLRVFVDEQPTQTEWTLVETAMGKLPHGLKRLVMNFGKSIDVSLIFASPAIETLQCIVIDGDLSSTLPFSAPELTAFLTNESIPDTILRSLAMYSTKLKDIKLTLPSRNDGQPVYFPLRGLEKVLITGATDELVEVLARNNRDLQSLVVRNEDRGRINQEDRKQVDRCFLHSFDYS